MVFVIDGRGTDVFSITSFNSECLQYSQFEPHEYETIRITSLKEGFVSSISLQRVELAQSPVWMLSH